jgi:hypothetical protein
VISLVFVKDFTRHTVGGLVNVYSKIFMGSRTRRDLNVRIRLVHWGGWVIFQLAFIIFALDNAVFVF